MSFLVDDQRIYFTLDDVYFMNSPSRWGEAVNLHGGGRLEGALLVQEYIDIYYDEGTKKVASHILVDHIQDVARWTIAFNILRLSGFATPHLENHVVMYYSVACMTPTVFERCSSLLDIVDDN